MGTFLSQPLRSPVDFRIPRMNIEPIDFTTSPIRRNFNLENNRVGIAARIVNNDATNNCTVRLHSPNGRARIVPPNSDMTIQEWFEEIHIIPDASTGSGQLEVDLVLPEDAKRRSNAGQ
jgi:hypothetical protein